MNVLLADTDPTAQKVMHSFLGSQGFEVEFASDSNSLLSRMNGNEAPMILILERTFSEGTGLDLCKKLRAANTVRRPYIIIFSSKSTPEDICAALECGADDCMPKPFNVGLTKTRMQAVRRLVEHQLELHRQLESVQEVNERHTLVQEMMLQDTKKPHRKPMPPVEQSEKKHKTDKVNVDPMVLGLQEVNFLLTSSLMSKRLAVESVKESAKKVSAGDFPCMAWSSQVLREKGYWVDFMILGDPDGVGELFQNCLGRTYRTINELDPFLSELANTIGNVFTRLYTARGVTSLQPFPSVGRSSFYDRLPFSPQARHFEISVDGVSLSFFMDFIKCMEKSVRVEKLRERDVLAEAFSPSEDMLPLIPAGAIVTARYLEKLRFLSESWEDFTIPSIYRPSALAEILLSRLRIR